MNKNTFERNCNTCKNGMFGRCADLKGNSEYQSFWDREKYEMFDGHVAAHKFKEDHICDEYACRYIEYPIEVSAIERNTDRKRYINPRSGKFVSVRLCREDNTKTYLGLLIGDLPIDVHITHNPDTKVLSLGYLTNPAIFVFSLNELVYGMESWWQVIESEDDLKEISDDDIQSVWYVKALQSLAKADEAPEKE